MGELARLGECKQASVSKETFKIYAGELLAFDMQDVTKALRELGRQPREAFQTAYPDLGTILVAVKQAQHERTIVRMRPFEKPYVPCGKHITGYLAYLNEQGEPCDRDSSVKPWRLQVCPCKRQWDAEYQAWCLEEQRKEFAAA